MVAWIQGKDGEASGREQGERAVAGQRGVDAAGGNGSGEQSSAEAGRAAARSTGGVHIGARSPTSILLLPVSAVQRVAAVRTGRLCMGAWALVVGHGVGVREMWPALGLCLCLVPLRGSLAVHCGCTACWARLAYSRDGTGAKVHVRTSIVSYGVACGWWCALRLPGCCAA